MTSKSEQARALKAANPQMSNRQIGRLIGLHRTHVAEAIARGPVEPRIGVASSVVGVTLPNGLNKLLRDEAKRSKRAMSAVIREAIREWLARRHMSASGEEPPKGSALSIRPAGHPRATADRNGAPAVARVSPSEAKAS